MSYPTLATISLLVAGLVMINSGPVVHAQSNFPVPPPPTSQIISQPPTSTFVQPCVNNGSNDLGPKDNGKQVVNQENQCTGTSRLLSQPIANAGPNQVVSQGSLVTLDGAGSFAQNGATIVSYSWVQVSGTTVSLNGANTAFPTFTAPIIATTLVFSLTVTDSRGAVSSPATVTVTVSGNNNNQPVAVATTPSQVVTRGSPVTLDGTGSFSPNGGTIVSYSWVQTAGPSVGVLPNTARPVFIAPQNSTTLGFSLTVTDNRGAVSSPSPPVFILVR